MDEGDDSTYEGAETVGDTTALIAGSKRPSEASPDLASKRACPVPGAGARQSYRPELPTTAIPPNPQTNQLNYIMRVVHKDVSSHRYAFPFLTPVDDVLLNLPDYYTIITNPMDLGTIKKRLRSGYYANAAACLADFELMFNNCYRYNRPTEDVYKMGQELERVYRDKLSGLPIPETVNKKYTPAPTKKSMRAVSNGTPRAHSSPVIAYPPTSADPVAITPPPPINLPGMKKERRASTRPVKAPSKDLPEGRKRVNGSQMKFCLNLIRELFHKRHQAYAWPFYKPVDVDALGLHDYHTIIKKPMDLGTVRDKLEKGLYKSGAEFASDVRMIFTNCYKYNAAGHDVVTMCKKLQEVFELEIAKMPEDDRAPSDSESDSSSETDEETQRHIDKLQRTLESLQQNMLEVLSNKKKKKHHKEKIHKKKKEKEVSRRLPPPPVMPVAPVAPPPPAPAPTPRAPPARRAPPAPPAPRQAPPPPVMPIENSGYSSDDDEFTYDDKRQLSLDIQRLASDKLANIATIIQQYEPSLDMGSGEFEIDFEQLNSRTLRALRAFTTESLNEKPIPKKRKATAAPKKKTGAAAAAVAPASAAAIPAAAPAAVAEAPAPVEGAPGTAPESGTPAAAENGEDSGDGMGDLSESDSESASAAESSVATPASAAVPASAPVSAPASAPASVAPVAQKSALASSAAPAGITFDILRQESTNDIVTPTSAAPEPEPEPSKPVVLMNRNAWAAITQATEEPPTENDADFAKFQRQRQEQQERERVEKAEREAREAARLAEEQRKVEEAKKEQEAAAAAAAEALAERERQRELERASRREMEQEIDLSGQSRTMSGFDEIIAANH
eukprot:m.222246 g.222246  ORF g.222246 m.222246 type:complete len:844 (-) comp10732_c0_seq1:3505-6036(-)